jgi:hypothetical protein
VIVGTDIQRKADKLRFRVTGVDENTNSYVLEPLDEFGAPFTVDAKTLRKEYGIDASDPAATDEQAGWQRISDGLRTAVTRASRPHRNAIRLPSPEEQFAGKAEDIAREAAAKIAADPDLLAEVEAGLRVVPEAVGRALDEIVSRPATPLHGAARRKARR